MVSGKVAGLGFSAASVAVVIFLLSSGLTDKESQVNMVELEVVYGGSFNVTITENGQERVESLFGFVKTRLQRVDREEWVISVCAKKLDTGSGALFVRFTDLDGNVLASASTIEPLGVACLVLTL